jgi:hypothetical protein
MNAALTNSIFALTQKNNLTDVNVEDLSHLIQEYPYFAPAQLIYAVKLKEDNHYRSEEQLQKTALYFSNPQWLEYQFMNGNLTQIHPLHDNTVLPETETITTTPAEDAVLKTESTNTEITPEIQSTPASSEITTQQQASKFEIPTVESVKDMMLNINHAQSKQVSAQPVDNTPAIPSFQEEIAPTLSAYSSDEEEVQMQKLSSVLSSQMADFKKPVEEDTKLEFEKNPFYTIDYFASQGIKFDPAKQPGDKLSQQLMTFTDWLKRMKHQSPNPQDLGTDPELENAIQGIANSSNEAKEIITETMAEVFIKQGKLDKAVQLYIKLSFLYPEKSTYFAAKIQELKGI